jgi:hypothetical protein
MAGEGGSPPYPENFGSPISISCSGTAYEIAVGDVTNDTKLDVVVLDTLGDSLCIAPGNGDGTFGNVTTFAVGTGPASVAIADVDGDGMLDVATVHPALGELHVARGTTSGLAALLSIPVGTNPQRVRATHLDPDSRADLVVSVEGDSTVAVLLGTPTGLGAPSFFPTKPHPKDVALGDANGDGFVDAVVLHDQSLRRTLLPGLGNGGFGEPEVLSNGGSGSTPAFSITLGDLNHDQSLDVASSHAGNVGHGVIGVVTSDPNGEIYANFITGDGVVPSEPRDVLLVDLLDDTDVELVTADRSAGEISIKTLHPDGGWSGKGVLTAPGPRGLAVGDFDGDAKLDLVAALDGGGAQVRLAQW